MKVDLHIHSSFSDGGLDIQTIFDELEKQNVAIASITDHNNIDAYDQIEKVHTHNIKIINGIEVDVEFNGIVYHMLMYGYNKNSKLFMQYLQNAREYDIEEFNRMIFDIEQKYGILLDKKCVNEFIDNNQYFDKVRLNNFLCNIGIAQTPIDAFYNFTKEIQDKKRLIISATEFFEIAKDCNAITSIAHPLKYVKSLNNINNLKAIIIELKTLGLNGIEVYNNRQSLLEEKELLEFGISHDFLITGGSDFHAKIGCIETKTLGKCLNVELKSEKLTVLNKIVHIN